MEERRGDDARRDVARRRGPIARESRVVVEVVHDEVDAAPAHLTENALAEPEVRERNAFRDLEIDVLTVHE